MKSIVEKAREIVTQLYERNMVSWNDLDREVVFAIRALNAEVQRMEALAQPEQEPVAWAMYQKGRLLSFWMDKGDAYNFEFTSEHSWAPLYTTPPQRPPNCGTGYCSCIECLMEPTK